MILLKHVAQAGSAGCCGESYWNLMASKRLLLAKMGRMGFNSLRKGSRKVSRRKRGGNDREFLSLHSSPGGSAQYLCR